jgi:alpha-N-arabinofuranosidase
LRTEIELAPFQASPDYYINPYLHSVFFEFFGKAIYDGVWVGRDSPIPNSDGIRQDVINGCIEAGIKAMRWPGGCCADHYHWRDGIGAERKPRLHPVIPQETIWRHDFGTDEFICFCRLIQAEPILIANVATGAPAEFLDWFEYCNGGAETKFGALRAANGHPEPYNVKIWGLGNTDENIWHIDYNNPTAYAQDYLRWRTAIQGLITPEVKLTGLGLSERHEISGWVERFLDHVTFGQRQKGPDSLSVHHYIGGAKARYQACGPAVDYTDEAYYFTLDALAAYQKDIDLHREHIAKHTSPRWRTTISFDEWGLWHPEATHERGARQRQTMRDALFAAGALHVFYRNCDIVEYAMETQMSNLLQSLFETDGPRFYRTPTFYVMKLFQDHLGQFLFQPTLTPGDPLLDSLASIARDRSQITITVANRDLYQPRQVILPALLLKEYRVARADLIAPAEARAQNTFDAPTAICSASLEVDEVLEMPKHSIARLILERKFRCC